MPDVTADLDRDEKEQEAGITPEMIEAGVKAFFSFDARFEDAEDAVKRIWRGMIAVSNNESKTKGVQNAPTLSTAE